MFLYKQSKRCFNINKSKICFIQTNLKMFYINKSKRCFNINNLKYVLYKQI